MRKLIAIGGAILLGSSMFVGCASKGFVLEEVKKSEDKTIAELSKQLNASVEKFSADVNKRIANIEANYTLKGYVDAQMSEREQKIMKDIGDRLNEIKTSLKDLAAIKEETMMKLSQNLQSSIGILLKQLNAQKEGLDIAIEEMEKFIGTVPGASPK
jgi:outer membrane murein-binding lipoprotein Lpp